MLPFSPPLIGEEEIQEVVDTLRSGWLSTGPKVKLFEEEFADKVGSESALALNSCTAGLHLSLAALGIGPGDEVIVPSMTFCATANVVVHLGATPVIVDVEPDTLNISPDCARDGMTERTKAIMPVHYAGHPADMDAVRAIAADRGVAIVEDAAHAVTAKHRGEFVGSGANPAAFSFYATKNLTTGEGGMLTGPPDFIDRCRTLSLHGMSRDAYRRYDAGGSWYYEVTEPGYKCNMSDIQASIGIWQLRKIAAFQERRREIVARYTAAFSSRSELQCPIERDTVESAWHLYVLRLSPDLLQIDRAQFIEELRERNIATSVHYIPLHMQPYYRDRFGLSPSDFPVATQAYENMFSLPLNVCMTDEDVDDVIAAVLEISFEFAR